MGITRISNDAKDDLALALIARIDTGSGSALLEFYDGTQPATPDTAVTTQVKLGTLTCSDPCGTQADGLLTFSAITQDSAADATGTATWARLKNPAGNAVVDFDVTNSVGTGAIKLNTVSIVTGGPILMTSLTVQVG